MESTKESKYKVIITIPAEKHFYELLDYFYEHYPLDRAEEIADELRNTTKNLEYQPERGVVEIMLSLRHINTVIFYLDVHLGQMSRLFTTSIIN